ncbi:MAG: neutral zinc metallopeptidase [Acidobacteriota bacterium]
MRWRTGRQSDNVEDRRGAGFSRGVRAGGLGGCGVLVVLLVALLMGVDPMELLQNVPSTSLEQPSFPAPAAPAGADDEMKAFVSTVLAETEDTWSALFGAAGERYVEPRLVLYSGYAQSACGLGQAAMGPFYCPADQRVYIDLSFYDELRSRFSAPGDFAQAYVIAHEIGHHVQNLLGITGQVEARRSRLSEEEANALSVRVELQADCLAGVWAHHAQRMRNILEPGDIEEALGAAAAIGDDRLQRQAHGYVVPDSFTHGTSAQRSRWFRVGLETGELDRCDTFRAAQP